MAKDPKTRAVTIPAGEVELAGDLTVPEGAQGMVLFAHGSGSSRHSPRNQFVARQLAEAGLATLLFDLFTLEEEERDRWTGELRFARSEEHTSELQSRRDLVCRLLLEKKK